MLHILILFLPAHAAVFLADSCAWGRILLFKVALRGLKSLLDCWSCDFWPRNMANQERYHISPYALYVDISESALELPMGAERYDRSCLENGAADTAPFHLFI